MYRKKLREVCEDELPWRSQANLLLAQCVLHRLLKRIHKLAPTDNTYQLPPDWAWLERSGVIMDGVIPTYPPAVPVVKTVKF